MHIKTDFDQKNHVKILRMMHGWSPYKLISDSSDHPRWPHVLKLEIS